MNKDVTILVNSCDKYECTWEPFFRLLKIQWPECDKYSIALNTEAKIYGGKEINVKTICCKEECTWTERFFSAVESIDSPYILFTLDDYFLINKVNAKVFENAVTVMKNNPKVGMICLSHTSRQNIKTDSYEDENFYSRVIDKNCKIWCRMCLYRREYLLKLLRLHETIWEFEQYASYRARKLDYIVLQQNSNDAEVFTFKVKVEDGYGLTLGKWLPKNIELFEQYGIEVNYDDLGINYEMYEEALKVSRSNGKTEGASSISAVKPQKQNPREILYNIKKWPARQRKKIKKILRKIRSRV